MGQCLTPLRGDYRNESTMTMARNKEVDSIVSNAVAVGLEAVIERDLNLYEYFYSLALLALVNLLITTESVVAQSELLDELKHDAVTECELAYAESRAQRRSN